MQTTAEAIKGKRLGLFIDGRFVEPRSGKFVDSYDPTTGEAWYQFAEGGADDVDLAISSAQRAFRDPSWRRMTQTARGKLVRRLADLVLEHAEDLALLETRDNGKLIKEMRAQMRAIPDLTSILPAWPISCRATRSPSTSSTS